MRGATTPLKKCELCAGGLTISLAFRDTLTICILCDVYRILKLSHLQNNVFDLSVVTSIPTRWIMISIINKQMSVLHMADVRVFHRAYPLQFAQCSVLVIVRGTQVKGIRVLPQSGAFLQGAVATGYCPLCTR